METARSFWVVPVLLMSMTQSVPGVVGESTAA